MTEQNEDQSWDPNWWVGTSINSEGWIAEMKIPFSQLRFKKNSGDVWGLEVLRTIYRKAGDMHLAAYSAGCPGYYSFIR